MPRSLAIRALRGVSAKAGCKVRDTDHKPVLTGLGALFAASSFMSERITYYGGASLPYIVTADDGTLFYCAVEPTESGELRWMFRSADGIEHVGPKASVAAYTDDLQHVVARWWE